MSKIKTLNIGIEKIGKIYHIADVHIRNLKRHSEYRDVFSQLYGQILSTIAENDIIVVAGDIVHAKTDMSPEVVDLTQEFFTRLSDLLPTIVIPGNHDANLNNPSRMDALQPIVNALKLDNLYYLRDTGVWKIGNCSFSHQSVFDESPGFPPPVDIEGCDYKIALFHGAVDKIVTEFGFVIENKKVLVDNFKGYDIVLLGDIHKPNNGVLGNDWIKYPGSLIMQNHAESVFPEHGILIWDVDTKRNEFVQIKNPYGYVTVDVENGKIVSNSPIPQKPRMRIRVKNTKAADLNKLIAELKKGRQIQELTVQKVITHKNSNESEKIVLQNVRDVAYQNKLIEEYLSDTEHLTEDQMSVVKGINTDLNAKLGSHTIKLNSTWIPKTFEFSNMFSYGPNNIIDFSNMKGAYGIFAPNASGKSTLWDALSFCIFDKCSRTSKAEDVMNYSKNSFDCKFTFDLNGVDYVIERGAKKSPKRGTVKVDTNFYKIENGVIESLNGEQRRDTNFIIREYVGTYDDFILTAMSTQSNNTGFIDKSQKERKELLAQFLDMDVFESLYQIASEEIKELSALLKDYKNQDLPTQLADAEDTLTSITGSLTQLEDKRLKLDSHRDSINTKIEFEVGSLKPVDDVGDVEQLESHLESLNKQRKTQETECGINFSELKSIEAKQGDVESKISNLNIDDLKEKNEQYKTYNNKFNEIGVQLDKLESQMIHAKKHLDGIGSLTFDDNCDHCVSNKNTPFAKQAQTLEDELQTLGKEYSDLVTKRIDVMTLRNQNDVTKELKLWDELSETSSKLEKEWLKISRSYESCLSLVKDYDTSIKNLEIDIQKAKNQQQAVEHNKLVKEKIQSLKGKRTEIEDSIKETTNELMYINSEIKVAEKTIENVHQSLEKLRGMETKYDGYEYYLKCVKRDGIPYNLISEVLPKLEMEINNILSPIVDFQILLNTDGKNINSFIAYSDTEYWPLELTSGMEKFISSIAIRTALINVSNLPRPNFIAIDEGFGSLDTDNFNSLYLLFDYLKTQFDFIITISHIDKTRDMVDFIIDINKIKGFSSIRYL
jgi:DNA repair exonuclease SbcCD ATPase subunit/DNA repair exonuclease SbcCD nuclease subunit